MPAASAISLTLARFPTARSVEPLLAADVAGLLFNALAADTRAAGMDAQSHTAYTFALLGLHASQVSAKEYATVRTQVMPSLKEATETWTGILVPVRHFGEVNYLNPSDPGPIFDCSADHEPKGPFVVITTAGFEDSEDLVSRATEFGKGVSGVRISMSEAAGLRSQQSFFFPGVRVFDGVTVTFWRDFQSMREFIYGPGVHKDWMTRQRKGGLADRTSFTRCAVLESEGTWQGSDPMSW